MSGDYGSDQLQHRIIKNVPERRGKGRTVSREKCSGDRDMAEWICDIFRGDGGDDGGSEDGGAGKHCPISAGTLAEPE